MALFLISDDRQTTLGYAGRGGAVDLLLRRLTEGNVNPDHSVCEGNCGGSLSVIFVKKLTSVNRSERVAHRRSRFEGHRSQGTFGFASRHQCGTFFGMLLTLAVC